MNIQTTARDDMRISVVIPAYNVEKYIERTIYSVLGQTCPPAEIIVVDDGSRDGTAVALRRFGGKIRLIEQGNAGASAARNAGIRAARYEWIAFLDGDDEWLPEKLEQQTAFLRRHPELEWTSGNYIRCQCGKEKRVQNLDEGQAKRILAGRETLSFFEAFQKKAYGCTITMLIRKNLLLKAGLFTEGLPCSNDIDMWFKIAYHSPDIGYQREPLAIYHMGVPDSIIKVNKKADVIIEMVRRHFELAQKHGHYEEFVPCARMILGYWINNVLSFGRGRDARQIIKDFEPLFSRRDRTTVWLKSFFPRWGYRYEVLKNRLRNIYRKEIC